MNGIYNSIKGISMIVLVITVFITVILLAIIVPSGIDKINTSRIVTFNHNISAIGTEVYNYMIMYNGEYPVKKDNNGDNIVYTINSGSELSEQVTKKGDRDDVFYIVDLKKLNFDNLDVGVGATLDDHYIMAATSRNIYYAKGIEVDGKIYHTRIDKGDGLVAIVPTSAPSPTPGTGATAAPTPSPTVIPGSITLRNVVMPSFIEKNVALCISGEIQDADYEDVFINYKSRPTDIAQVLWTTEELLTTVSSDTTWQSFSAEGRSFPGGAYYEILIWAEDSSGNKSNEVSKIIQITTTTEM